MTHSPTRMILASMRTGKGWTRDELLAVLWFYCLTPFGKLDARNRAVIELAKALGRTPSSVAMKACNFASLDPAHRQRGVKGLSGASTADRDLWTEFAANSESIVTAAGDVYRRFMTASGIVAETEPPSEADVILPQGPTEVVRLVRTRRVQAFFAAAVLESYQYQCALTGLGVRELLNASHIIPWSQDEKRRAHPSNGIALNVLYDRAFDRHLITFDDDLRVIISPRLKCEPLEGYQREMVEKVEGKQLRLPVRFRPDMDAVRWHRGSNSEGALRR